MTELETIQSGQTNLFGKKFEREEDYNQEIVEQLYKNIFSQTNSGRNYLSFLNPRSMPVQFLSNELQHITMSFPGMLTVLSIREQNNPLAYIPLV
jgi:hypothetical protein